MKKVNQKIKLETSKPRNFVAKYDYMVNKAQVFVDKKKEYKAKGYFKNKKSSYEDFFVSIKNFKL